MPAIAAALNPRLRVQDDRLGWEYEGFFFEAQDEHGVPFLAVFDFHTSHFNTSPQQRSFA